MKVDLEDQFKILVSGYFGIQEMDEYDLKVYVLKDIENYIIEFLENNPIDNFNYRNEAANILDTLSIKRKLQDAMLVLNKIDGPLDLKLLIKTKLRSLN
mgnify:CR=1 FL=1